MKLSSSVEKDKKYFGNASDHVLDVGAHGSYNSCVLASTEPYLDCKSFGTLFCDLALEMLE